MNNKYMEGRYSGMRRAIYEDDVIKLLDKGWKSGVYPVASNIHALPSAQPEGFTKKSNFKPGDKFILEIGERQLDEFEIAGTDYYIRISLLEKLTQYKPEVQSEPKKGHWVEVHGYVTPGGDPVWACSECGKGIHVYGVEHGTYGSDVSDGQWVSCPNCGAVMEENNG